MLNFEAIVRAEVKTDPFKFFMAPGVISAVELAAVRADFPKITTPGIFSLSKLPYGPAFAKLIEDIRSPEFEEVIEKKYGVDLSDKPMMITVCDQTRKKDRHIHTDSKAKFISCVLYLNNIWDDGGGRLRMLRNKHDLSDYILEVSPRGGTLASYIRADNSWHGYEPYEGQRRYVMFNWMASLDALERDVGCHGISARAKHHVPFFYKGT